MKTEHIVKMARDKLLAYSCARWRGYRPAEHHKVIARTLEQIDRGEEKRVMLFMPPRHGKSHLASSDFPAHYVGRHPDNQVICASYGQELASEFGRSVRNQIAYDDVFAACFPKVELRSDSQSASRFHINKRGVYQAVGAGGAIMGKGADLLIIDDPIKGRKEADSEVERKNLKSWYASDAYTRLMPDAAIVVIQTRWHHDDLSGWLLSEHAHENWKVIKLKAIADKDDILGRKPGEALWPEAYPLKTLEKIHKTIGDREFEALYQQEPSIEDGNILKRSWWRQWPQHRPLPKCSHIFQSYDTAYSKEGYEKNSYSARTTWGIFYHETEHRNCILLLEAWREREGYPDLRKGAKRAYQDYKPDRVLIEKKASGQSLIQDMRRAGLPVTTYQPDRDKISRAYAVQAVLQSGQVFYPDRQWAEPVIRECAQFPTGTHDDFVDTCTQAWLWLRNGWYAEHPDDKDLKKITQIQRRQAAYG